MPPTITASQVRPSTTLLMSPLTRDVIITLQWQVDDEREEVTQQGCTLQLAPGCALAAQVDHDKRSYSFRLAKGTALALPLVAQVQTELGARTNPPARAHLAGPFASNDVEITFPTVLVPEREAISTVYGELNQELRRTRTLYESFLVVVTAGLATLYSKKDVIAGASHRCLMTVGLATLAIIVLYMLWAVHRRYTRTMMWVGNLECALGVRIGNAPENLMPNETGWWATAWPHKVWIAMLGFYVLVLLGSAWLLLRAKPDVPTPPAQNQTLCCDCIRQALCNSGDLNKGTQAPTNSANKATTPAPPKSGVKQNQVPVPAKP